MNERCNTSLHGSHLIFSENAHRDLPEKRLAHRYQECSKVSDTSSAVAKDRQATSDAHELIPGHLRPLRYCSSNPIPPHSSLMTRI